MPDVSSFPPLTDAEFDELVVETQLPVVLYIQHKCSKLSNLARREAINSVQPFRHLVAAYEVDADIEKALVQRLDVKGVPILLVFLSGAEVAALLGFHRADELQKRLWGIFSTGSDD